jgi:AcrR family transcriptional regulator
MSQRVHENSRRAPSQERSRATVDAILTAAAHVLAAEGYAKANTNRIARVAGISVGSLYQYFSCKEAVYDAFIEALLEELSAHAAEALAASAGDARTRLSRLIHSLLRAVAPHAEVIRRLDAVPGTRFREELRQAKQRVAEVLAAFLRANADALDVDDYDAAARLILDAGEGVAYHLEEAEVEATAAQFTQMVLRFTGAV